ncbi:iron siderophore-binding protein [Chlorogloeopsis fritschii PCC 6912]|uniref:Iron siderophore-binding protein n=1 Tax=Chlorogloeopsis fritschii PCC 6912 TaxID=211165 RepID=A0A3S1FDE3_CHLFR|nr:iron-siderophore ABC transporter substrate-binding protein [Chlorogloeopsis fritschii]RUR75925.1 iron siderophore-binding protein [Chlorogloeopsis fritschii PCC 6912]
MRNPTHRLKKLFLLVAFSFLLITACYSSITQKPNISKKQLATSECRVIQHQLGETCIPLKPQRIIALEDAWIVDPLLALGIKPVGTVTFAKQVNVNFRGLSADELAGIEIVGNGGQPSLEKILSLKPDLILSFNDPFDSNNYKLLSQIAPTVPIEFDRVRHSFKDNLRFIAQLVGREEKAEKILLQYQERIKELQKILVNNNLYKSKVSILEYLGGNTFELQRGDIIYFQIFSDIGLDMPHKPLNPDDSVLFNIEVIDKFDADILFFVSLNSNKEQLSSRFNGILSSLKAVKNKRAHIVDPYLWWVYGPLGVNKLLDELPKYLLESV